MGTAKAISYGVLCEACGQRTPKTIAWLTIHNQMPCGQCGAVIDLGMGDNAVIIQKLANQCADIDASSAQRT